nr:MAG TPA: hypothetical protein [Caudoviricetes sp.]
MPPLKGYFYLKSWLFFFFHNVCKFKKLVLFLPSNKKRENWGRRPPIQA